MRVSLFRNKAFVSLVIVAFAFFALSAKVARADDDILGWVITAIGLIVGFALSFICGPCGLGTLFAGEFFGFAFAVTTVDLFIATASFAAKEALCIGTGILGNCDDGQDPDLYFRGSGSIKLGTPAPIKESENISATCNSVTFDYTLKNVSLYGIYRNGTRITQSETCFPRDPSAEPVFNLSYADNGLNPGTAYTYQLFVEDISGQPFSYPEFEVTTKTPPNCN